MCLRNLIDRYGRFIVSFITCSWRYRGNISLFSVTVINLHEWPRVIASPVCRTRDSFDLIDDLIELWIVIPFKGNFCEPFNQVIRVYTVLSIWTDSTLFLELK